MSNNTRVFNTGRGQAIKVDATGKFLLEKKIAASKRQKFTLTNIVAEVPYGKTKESKDFFYTSDLSPLNSLYIDKIKTTFEPDKSLADAKNVLALIGHRDVRVAEMSDEQHSQLVRLKLKKSNPKFILTNIDKVRDEKHQATKEKVQALSLIYNKTYSAKQLSYICSEFNIPYKIEETFEDAKRDALEIKIEKWLDKSDKNPGLLIAKIENLSEMEDSFYFDQFERLGLIVFSDGYYRLASDKKPIGMNRDHVIDYNRTNVQDYNYLKEQALNLLKQEEEERNNYK